MDANFLKLTNRKRGGTDEHLGGRRKQETVENQRNRQKLEEITEAASHGQFAVSEEWHSLSEG